MILIFTDISGDVSEVTMNGTTGVISLFKRLFIVFVFSVFQSHLDWICRT